MPAVLFSSREYAARKWKRAVCRDPWNSALRAERERERKGEKGREGGREKKKKNVCGARGLHGERGSQQGPCTQTILAEHAPCETTRGLRGGRREIKGEGGLCTRETRPGKSFSRGRAILVITSAPRKLKLPPAWTCRQLSARDNRLCCLSFRLNDTMILRDCLPLSLSLYFWFFFSIQIRMAWNNYYSIARYWMNNLYEISSN